MNKQKTLTELQKESTTVYDTALLIRNLYIFGIGCMVLAMAAGIFFPTKLAELVQKDNVMFLGSLIQMLTYEHPLRSDGSFNSAVYLLGCSGAIIESAISAFIFHTILQVFRNIKHGETPFTTKNTQCWKRCCRIYAVLAVASFLGTFVLRFVTLPLFITTLLSACFFLSLSLIFEYGGQLQQESDETL